MSYLRLLRISNGPTAVADILMGVAVATGSFEPVLGTTLLVLASLGIYHGGMVLNDVIDQEKDQEERPERPIPSGAVPLRQAKAFAAILILTGSLLGIYVGIANEAKLTILSAVMLPVFVVAYNSKLKSTALGPWLMGGCRALNGMMGLGLATNLTIVIAISPGVMLYIAGVTLLARNEATKTNRKEITSATFYSVFGIIWICLSPLILNLPECHLGAKQPLIWITLFTIILLMICRHHAKAILKPTPKRVQTAVVNAIQGLVMLNAAIALGYVDYFSAVTILAMLPLAKLLSLWIPAT